MKIIKRNIVAGLIIAKNGKIFLGRKDPNQGGVYSDSWHMPGGGVDDDESLRNALVREIQEEIGIDIKKAKINLIDNTYTGKSEKVLEDTDEKVICEMKFNDYLIELDEVSDNLKINLGDDLVVFKWFNKEDLKGLKLTPPAQNVFKKLNYL